MGAVSRRAKSIVNTNRSEAFTLLGTLLSLVGVILQFQGLRGLHWVASIAQLVAVFVMTMFRAWVQRELIVRPVAKEVLDGYEMDWLALAVACLFVLFILYAL